MTHPLPQAARETWLSLDGVWDVRLGGGPWREIRVPFAFEAGLSGIGAAEEVHERLRYRRRFRVPRDWGARTLLRFGAVDWRAEVSLDGVRVGAHDGGYAHFAFDLGRLQPGSEHELVVDVFDPADDGFGQAKGKQRGSRGIWYARTTGIWRSVWLVAGPVGWIEEATLRTTVDGVVRAEADAELVVRAEGEVVARGTREVRVRNPRLWSPEDPFLYDVELRLGDDRVTSYVGFRSIRTQRRELLLNDRPLRIAGVLDQGFWHDGGYTPPSDEALRADVEAAKAFGFNLVRKHVKVEDPRWYAWCDRLGLLVAQDMPASHDLRTAEAREQFAREWTEVLHQLAGHPSIVMWLPFNEDWGEPSVDFHCDLLALTRREDPTRLVVDASGWMRRIVHTDLVDIHDYDSPLHHHRKYARARLPVWFGECGGILFPVNGHQPTDKVEYRVVTSGAEFADGYRRLVEGIPEDVFGFVWTQLADVEAELNGLLTHEREPKLTFDEIRAVNEAFLRNGLVA